MMGWRIEIIVGAGVDRHGNALSEEDMRYGVEQSRELMANKYGGFTEYRHTGGWRDDDGTMVVEQGITFIAFAKVGADAQQSAEFIRRAFDQQSAVLNVTPANARFI